MFFNGEILALSFFNGIGLERFLDDILWGVSFG
jgi:hypothetical protein